MYDLHDHLVSDQWRRVNWLGFAMTLGSVFVGWMMPEFYDWTEADQSRPAPVVGWIALVIVVVDALLILGMFVLYCCSKQGSCGPSSALKSVQQTGGILQFSLGQLLGAVTMVALLFVIGRCVSPLAGAWSVFFLVFAWAISVALRNLKACWSIVLILWLQYTPFLWLVRQVGRRVDTLELFAMLPAFPSFFPAIFLIEFFQSHFQSGQWIGILFTSVNLLIGTWLACQGRKRTLAFGLITMTFSFFGSFLLHAAMRA